MSQFMAQGWHSRQPPTESFVLGNLNTINLISTRVTLTLRLRPTNDKRVRQREYCWVRRRRRGCPRGVLFCNAAGFWICVRDGVHFRHSLWQTLRISIRLTKHRMHVLDDGEQTNVCSAGRAGWNRFDDTEQETVCLLYRIIKTSVPLMTRTKRSIGFRSVWSWHPGCV